MNSKLKNIIIATGGTGGHIFPACSLAKHLIDKKINVKLISDKRGMRYLKEYPNLNIIQITSSTISKKNFFKFCISSLIILYSIFRSIILLSFNRVNLVFGMGGYSSFPICIAAKILRVPFVIYENNLHIGKANKFLLPFAKKAFVSHIDLEGVSHKYMNKLCEIGNIISNNILKYFSKINLAITRSGSSMLAELINLKIPFIAIPLPTSADNHQLKNAIYYEKNDYSYLIEEKDLSKKLFKLIKLIHEDRSLLDQIINKQSKYSDRLVYENIDNEIKKIIDEKN